MTHFWRALVGVCLILALSAHAAVACDTCGCALVPIDERGVFKGWQISVVEQTTDFDKLQTEGKSISNDQNQRFTSSVTEFILGYNFNDRFGVSLNVPYISRSFSRIVGDTTPESGVVGGLGDVIVNGRYVLSHVRGENHTLIHTVQLGIKLPTGSADELKEQALALDGGPDSVVGGHDLTLGSGSLDFLVNSSLYWRSGKWTGSATAQYALRNPGASSYRFGNELQWDVSVGRYLGMNHQQATALLLDVNGSNKVEDTFEGTIPVVDTGASEVYLGPKLVASWGQGSSAYLDFNLPIHQYNTDTQLVPAWRLHAGVTWRR